MVNPFLKIRLSIPAISHFRGSAIWSLSSIVFLANYFPLISLSPSFDDWTWLVPIREFALNSGVWASIPEAIHIKTGSFWRPLTVLMHALAAINLAFPHVLRLVFILVISLQAIRLSRLAGISRTAGFILAAAFLSHQCLVVNGVELDYSADVICGAALYGLLSVSWRYGLGECGEIYYLCASAIFSAIAVFAKEPGISALFIPLISIWIWPARRYRKARTGHWFALGIVAVVITGYFATRIGLHIPMSSPDPIYRMGVGSNTFLNLALGGVFSYSPVNTINVAIGIVPWKLAAASWSLAVAAMIIHCVFRKMPHQQWRLPLALLILIYSLQGPTMLLPHLTEGNMIRSLLPALLLAAWAIETVWKGGASHAQRGITFALAVWFGWSLLSVREKLTDLQAVHLRTGHFRKQVKHLMPVLPPGRDVLFVVERGPKGYAEFTMPFSNSIQGDAGYGLVEEYRGFQVRTRIRTVQSLAALPDAGDTASIDFVVSRDADVRCLSCEKP